MAVVIGVAGIDYVHNGMMIERRQELAFPDKAVAPRRTMTAGAEQFYGYLLLNLAICALGQINGSHPTCAEDTNSPIRPPMRRLRLMIGLQHLFRRAVNTLR
jgi:hypothetical protein